MSQFRIFFGAVGPPPPQPTLVYKTLTAPQQCAAREYAGYGVALVAAAAIIATVPVPRPAFARTLPQTVDVQQGSVYHTQIQQFIAPPNRPKTWTLPQPFDVQQGRVDHVLIQQFIAPPNRPKTWTGPQQYGVDQGRVDHTLIQQFIAPPNRPAFATNPQFPELVYPAVFDAWQYPILQDPPLRPAIATKAETPLDVPSSVRGDVAQYAPTQPTPTGASFEFGTHEAQIRQSHHRTSVWGKPPPSRDIPPQRPYVTTTAEVPQTRPSSFKVVNPEWVPPPPQPVPVAPRYEYGTHSLHVLQAGNRASITVPWPIRLYEAYFISLDTIGERDEDQVHRPSVVFHQAPAEGTPPVVPDDRPVVIQTLPQEYGVDQGSIYRQQLDALVETLAIRDQASFTLPQEYQVRNDSHVYHAPPESVYPPTRYWQIVVFPQDSGVYTANQSRLFPRNASTLPSVPIAGFTFDLVGVEIDVYQGILTPEVVTFVGRIVTEPQLLGETAELDPPFDFARHMEPGETITSATVASTVYSGVDATPSAIRYGAPRVVGTKVYQKMRNRTLGCVYELICTVRTSLGQTLQQSTYFYTEPDLP